MRSSDICYQIAAFGNGAITAAAGEPARGAQVARRPGAGYGCASRANLSVWT